MSGPIASRSMMSLIQIAFPKFNRPPTAGNAGVKPIQTATKVDLKAAARELKELREKHSA